MSTYKRHRFPPGIISHAVLLYYRFNLSHRDIEDLLAERGIIVTRESIRLWCTKFGAKYARRLKQRHRGFGDTLYIDEVFVKINGKQHYLWRAVVSVFTKPQSGQVSVDSRMTPLIWRPPGCRSTMAHQGIMSARYKCLM